MRAHRLLTLLLWAAPLTAQQPLPEEVAQETSPPTTVITGTLLGADGQPMRLAHVSLYPLFERSALQTVEVAPDGAFRLEAATTGIFSLWFTGVDHFMQSLPLLVLGEEDEIGLDVRLRTHEYLEDLSNLKVIGDFNDFSFQSGARPMEHREDEGTYVLEVEVEADTFAYQVINAVTGRSVNGTQSDRFVYDGGGDYVSVIDVEGDRVRIVFDPEKLKIVDAESMLRFREPESLAARYADFREQLAERSEAYLAGYNERKEAKVGQDSLNAYSEAFDWSPNAMALDSTLAVTRDPELRNILLVSYLTETYTVGVDSLRARQILAEIGPDSRSWTYGFNLLQKAFHASRQPDAYENYAYAVLRENPSERLKAGMLNYLLGRAHRDDRKAEARLLFTWLVSEYPESFEARWAKAEYDPNRAIREGQPIPEFTVASLEDSTVIYSNESLKGEVYLLDFWAVWCGPCIGELPHLHDAYEKYQEDGLVILSLSFDGSPDDVTKYREESEWKMPWLHGFVEGGFESDLAERFQVLGIPKVILVGADGNILATESDLRGERLGETLARVFGRESEEAEEPSNEQR